MAMRLRAECADCRPYTPSDPLTLYRSLKVGDVLLVEGSSRISSAIKYLTQSTWSHATLYVGDSLPPPVDGSERARLVEVNVGEGCIAAPLSKYARHNTRICRAISLSDDDRQAVARFMIARLGMRYDMRNILDLVRYFFPAPPVPARWRRRMIALGSGDPTRAICSSLIAQAFQSVRYPILPRVTRVLETAMPNGRAVRKEILQIRHHSLFVPRDFDLSPYFEIVKPEPACGVDYKSLLWADRLAAGRQGEVAADASASGGGEKAYAKVIGM